MTHDEIKAALEERCPGVRTFTAGPLWSVTLPCGTHTGAREDPFSLLNDLIAIRDAPPYAEPEPEPGPEPVVEVIEEHTAPDPDDALRAALERMEKAREAVQAANAETVPAQPPASIADLFQPDRPLAPQAKALHDLWLSLGHQVQRGAASPDEVRKHQRLTAEIQFIKKHAFEAL